MPAAYLIQVQHYLDVTGKEKGYTAVLIAGNRFVWKEIKRDEELVKVIIDAEIHFWAHHVLQGHETKLDGSSAAEKFDFQKNSMKRNQSIERMIKSILEFSY